jgi:nucleotide-binding universal stress UspA family protein
VGDEPAFHHALKIATAARARLEILHAEARDIDNASWAEYPEVRHTLERWGLLDSESGRGAVAAKLGIKVKKMLSRGGDPVEAIARHAAEDHADMIVLATHGRTGLPRWLKGSIAESAARRAWAMTLFVPRDARGFIAAETGAARLERILVPVDMSPRPEPALEAAAALTGLLGAANAECHLLHVGAAGDAPSVLVPAGLGRPPVLLAREGNVVDAILGAADDIGADLIVMSTHGRHGFLDAVRGSTTEQVLRRAPCPLLAVPCLI